jgi:hypothetical protein
MKLIKKIKSLIALKKAIKGCIIVHELDEKNNDMIIPYIEWLSDEGAKKLTETWELFGGGFVGDTMSGKQGYYCMLMDLPFSKWLRKDNVMEEWHLWQYNV